MHLLTALTFFLLVLIQLVSHTVLTCHSNKRAQYKEFQSRKKAFERKQLKFTYCKWGWFYYSVEVVRYNKIVLIKRWLITFVVALQRVGKLLSSEQSYRICSVFTALTCSGFLRVRPLIITQYIVNSCKWDVFVHVRNIQIGL